MKNIWRRCVTALCAAVFLTGPAALATGKTRPEIVFEHKYNQKYNCTVRMEALRLLAPLMGDEFKAELTDYYIALSDAIEEAQKSSGGQAGQMKVSAKGIDSLLTVKEEGMMDVRINLPKAWLTLHDVTVKDIRRVFEKYLL